ncbi:MAG: hypothetical protein JO206_09540, partial [Solirubrobacterales bacterium]|nr:hypothetical protein [Solirubrobacterales bacterium]
MKALEALPEHAPDLVDPVVGYRQWRLVEGTLRSPHRGAQWARTEVEASCDTGLHDPQDTPAKGCTCGIYAYYDPCPRTASAGTRDLVGGAVVLWGRIELHATAMRAQRGAIAVLERPILPGRKRRELTTLATRLGV